ncbi:MAG: alcohol dehydrogenase catalytic domain-containing protein [Planctomycetota bacterium]|jgi:2-desacetyl-2-hydroxyethyl bacteriochlorophyllide A dehydrogenase|nr:alcohol dehydrogenase catalytic domain-containing protein [Planctomycetota bacterium]
MADLPKKMKALVARAPGQYKVEEVDTPRAGEGEIIIKIEACGICAGDAKAYHGAERFWGGPNQPAYIKAPVIPGHEFIGRVVELGPNAQGDFKIGDRLASDQIVPCWECKFCKTGRYWMCQKHDIFGFQNNVNGGFAEYTRLPKGALNWKVPGDLPMKSAILVEPYACAKHAVDRAQVTPNDVVVLAGAGCLGLGMTGYLRMHNPQKLIVLDMKDARLKLAKQFGADLVLNPSKDDVVKTVLDLTDGYGADIYIEATGHPASVKQGMAVVRKLGRFVEFSVFGAETTLDWSIIGDVKELDLLGSHLSPYCFPSVIEWIANGKLPTEGVVTHVYKLDKWQEAFELAASGENATRVVIEPV